MIEIKTLSDMQGAERYGTCPSCGWDNSLIIPRNFCPNCGARLAQEGEDNDS